jgi:hypothetical protein
MYILIFMFLDSRREAKRFWTDHKKNYGYQTLIPELIRVRLRAHLFITDGCERI